MIKGQTNRFTAEHPKHVGSQEQIVAEERRFSKYFLIILLITLFIGMAGASWIFRSNARQWLQQLPFVGMRKATDSQLDQVLNVENRNQRPPKIDEATITTQTNHQFYIPELWYIRIILDNSNKFVADISDLSTWNIQQPILTIPTNYVQATLETYTQTSVENLEKISQQLLPTTVEVLDTENTTFRDTPVFITYGQENIFDISKGFVQYVMPNGNDTYIVLRAFSPQPLYYHQTLYQIITSYHSIPYDNNSDTNIPKTNGSNSNEPENQFHFESLPLLTTDGQSVGGSLANTQLTYQNKPTLGYKFQTYQGIELTLDYITDQTNANLDFRVFDKQFTEIKDAIINRANFVAPYTGIYYLLIQTNQTIPPQSLTLALRSSHSTDYTVKLRHNTTGLYYYLPSYTKPILPFRDFSLIIDYNKTLPETLPEAHLFASLGTSSDTNLDPPENTPANIIPTLQDKYDNESIYINPTQDPNAIYLFNDNSQLAIQLPQDQTGKKIYRFYIQTSIANGIANTLTQIARPPEQQQILIIPFTYQSDPHNKPFTRDQLSKLAWSGLNSPTDYYLFVSENQLWFDGQITEWITIPQDHTTCGINIEAINQQLQQQGIQLEVFSHFLYIHPDYHHCPPITHITNNDSGYVLNGLVSSELLIQNIDKHLGIGSNNYLDCGKHAISDYYQCKSVPNGDKFSQPNHSTNRWLNMVQRVNLNWVAENKILKPQSSDTYELYASNLATEQTQVIILDKADTGEQYYLEYRPQISGDPQPSAPESQGAILYIGYLKPQSTYSQTITYNIESHLIDTHPNTPGNASDAPFSDNTTFIDPLNRIAITQLSHDQEKVTLRINFAN